MPAEPIEPISTQELALIRDRLSAGLRAVESLVEYCDKNKVEQVWIYRRKSLRMSVERIEPVVPEINRTIDALIRGKPLGPDSSKARKPAIKELVKHSKEVLKAHQQAAKKAAKKKE